MVNAYLLEEQTRAASSRPGPPGLIRGRGARDPKPVPALPQSAARATSLPRWLWVAAIVVALLACLLLYITLFRDEDKASGAVAPAEGRRKCGDPPANPRTEAELAEQRADGLAQIVSAVLDGSAPRNVRSAAARGALPLPRPELVRLYVALREDENEEIRTAADSNLRGLDSQAVCEALAADDCVGDVLEYFVPRAARDEKIAEKITFRAEVPPAALEQLASSGTAAVIELVLTNQERLLTPAAAARPAVDQPRVACRSARPDPRIAGPRNACAIRDR